MSIEDKLSIIMQLYVPVVMPLLVLWVWFWVCRRFMAPRQEASICRPSIGRLHAVAGVVVAVVSGVIGANVEFPLPTTRYADGYTRLNFNRIRIGDSADRVYDLLGKPLSETRERRTERIYEGLGLRVHVSHKGHSGPWIVRVEGPAAKSAEYRVAPWSREDVLQLPEPDSERDYEVVRLRYSDRPYRGNSNYWWREIYLDGSKKRVVEKRSKFYTDL